MKLTPARAGSVLAAIAVFGFILVANFPKPSTPRGNVDYVNQFEDPVNAAQLAYYQATVKNQTAPVPVKVVASGSYASGVHASYTVSSYEFAVTSFHASDVSPRTNLVSPSLFRTYMDWANHPSRALTAQRGWWVPDCLRNCHQGINYFADPTTLIVNTGRCWEQDAVFINVAAECSVTFGAVGTAFAVYLGWSVDTHTPANGDTYGGGALIPCSSNNLIVDANGLRDVAASTQTAGGAGATVTTTLAKTFSITGTYTAVQVACIIVGSGTNADAGPNPQIYAESTFGPDSFVSGDSLTGTWTIART